MDRQVHAERAPELGPDADELTMRVGGYMARVVPGEAGGMLVGFVDELPGAHTQANSIEELHFNLCEVIQLVTERASAPDHLPER